MGSRQCQGTAMAYNHKDICLKGARVDVLWYYNNVPLILQKNLYIIMYIDSNRYFAQMARNVQAKELSLISEHHGHLRLVSLLCWHIKSMLIYYGTCLYPWVPMIRPCSLGEWYHGCALCLLAMRVGILSQCGHYGIPPWTHWTMQAWEVCVSFLVALCVGIPL